MFGLLKGLPGCSRQRWHLNPFGRYYFDLVRMRQDGGQLVELPSEPSTPERVGP
jgi:hypothetical protein